MRVLAGLAGLLVVLLSAMPTRADRTLSGPIRFEGDIVTNAGVVRAVGLDKAITLSNAPAGPSLIDTPGTLAPGYAWPDAKRWSMYLGTEAAPVTTAGPLVSLSGNFAVPVSECAGNPAATGCSSVLMVSAKGTAATGMVISGITTFATGSSSVFGVDVQPFNSLAFVTGGTRVAIGAYIDGRRYVTTAQARGIELSVGNFTGSACALGYLVGGECDALTIVGKGTADLSAAIKIVAGGEPPWGTGSPSFREGISFNTSSVIETTLIDLSLSTTSIAIGGSHVDAIRITPGGGNVGIGILGATIARLQVGGKQSEIATSAPAWGASGIAFVVNPVIYTDTTSSGTVANNIINSFGTVTLAASSPTTYTDAANLVVRSVAAGTNVTLTNAWAARFYGKIKSYGLHIDSVSAPGVFNLGGSALISDGIWNDTTSSGTIAVANIHRLVPILTAANPTLLTSAVTLRVAQPTLSTNVTATNSAALSIRGAVSLEGSSQPAWASIGASIRQQAATWEDTTSSGTVVVNNVNYFGQPTLTALAPVTYTNATTVVIGPAPTAGTNVTIGESYSLTVGGPTWLKDHLTAVNLLPTITPQQYGASGLGVVDDTAAVQAWATALATGQYLGQCSGIFRLTASVSFYSTAPYRVSGAVASTGASMGCNFKIDYNDWTSAAIDLTNPTSPTTSNRGANVQVWENIAITYNTALTAPPIAFRHRYSTGLHLRNVKITQYTVNRGTCLSITSAFNVRLHDNVQIWGCGGNVSAHLVPGGTTFSITSGATTLTSSAAFFSAADVGQDIFVRGTTYDEVFTIASFTNTTTVEVTRAASITHTAQIGAISSITGTMTAASPTLTVNVANLVANDVGRNVYALGCGTTTGTAVSALRSTVTGVSGTTITLADNAATSCAVGSHLVFGPSVEIYDDADGTITNDVTAQGLHVEDAAGTQIVIRRATGIRGGGWKLHSQNLGATNTELSQFNAVLVETDTQLNPIFLAGVSVTTAGQMLIQGNTLGGVYLSAITGVHYAGQPAVAASKMGALTGITVGPIEGNHRSDAAWNASLVTTDGTGRGILAQGAVTTALTAVQLPKLIATNTNDEACDTCVGKHIFAYARGITATVTVTIASPGVVTWTAHGLSSATPSPINFTTTGALPTGLVAATNYWTVPGTVTADTFQLATSIANAIAGTAINTSGSQSGTHTGLNSAYMTTATPISILGISLGAGDWQCSGVTDFDPPGSTTQASNQVGISSTVNSIGTATNGDGTHKTNFASSAGNSVVLPTGVSRKLLSATTTVYMGAQASHAVSTLQTKGRQDCRRMR